MVVDGGTSFEFNDGAIASMMIDLKVLKNTIPFVFQTDGIGYLFGSNNS